MGKFPQLGVTSLPVFVLLYLLIIRYFSFLLLSPRSVIKLLGEFYSNKFSMIVDYFSKMVKTLEQLSNILPMYLGEMAVFRFYCIHLCVVCHAEPHFIITIIIVIS